MRFSLSIAVLAASLAGPARAASGSSAPQIELPAVPGVDAPAPIAAVLAWVTENAPECPPSTAPEVAAKFLEQLKRTRPGEADRLGSADLPVRRFESQLWQTLAARLAGPAYETQRELFATRRAQSLVAAQGGEADTKTVQAAVTKLRNDSPAAYRRLTDGKMEDDDVLRLPGLNNARESQRKSAALAAAQPKALTAAEIAGEFSRRNQVGAAAAKLRAYQLEARLKNPDGSEVDFLLYRLRPDRFRVHLVTAGRSTSIVAHDGTNYWRQVPGKAEIIPVASAGALRHLGEFLDLLFEPGDTRFERREDTLVDGRKCYRLAITRADGTGYVTELDQENFHELGREEADGQRTRYSDFREVAGFTLPHREDVTYPNGKTGSLVIRRFTANPGLVDSFFAPPRSQQIDFFSLEQLLGPVDAPAMPSSDAAASP